jgi:hypothetical protein
MSAEYATRDDVQRLEAKVDRVYEAVERLVRLEERQETQGARIGALEQRAAALETAHRATDRKVDAWVNRGVGMVALLAAVWSLVQFLAGAK